MKRDRTCHICELTKTMNRKKEKSDILTPYERSHSKTPGNPPRDIDCAREPHSGQLRSVDATSAIPHARAGGCLARADWWKLVLLEQLLPTNGNYTRYTQALYRPRHIDRPCSFGSVASNTNTTLGRVTRATPQHRHRPSIPSTDARRHHPATIPWLPHWIALCRRHYHNLGIFHGHPAEHGLWLQARLATGREGHMSIDRTRRIDTIFKFLSLKTAL